MKRFSELQLSESDQVAKVIKNLPPENAVKELNNILVIKSFDEISFQDIKNLNERYRVDIKKKFKSELIIILENFANYYLALELPNEGSEFLTEFAEFLGIEKKN